MDAHGLSRGLSRNTSAIFSSSLLALAEVLYTLCSEYVRARSLARGVSRMKRLFFSTTILLIALALTSARADLNTDVRAVLQDKALAKGETGVVLARVDENRAKPEILFRHNSDIALMPASNLKLITTAAFLDRFGPDFKFRTILAQRGQDLLLIGDGDPSFGDAELLKRVDWESTTVFSNWAAMLKKRGVTSV